MGLLTFDKQGMPLVPHAEYQRALGARGPSFFFLNFYVKQFSTWEVKDGVAGPSITRCNKWMQSVSM